MKNFGRFSRYLLPLLALCVGLALYAVYIPRRSPDDGMGIALLVLLSIIVGLMIWSASFVLAIISLVRREKYAILTLVLSVAALLATLVGFGLAFEVGSK